MLIIRKIDLAGQAILGLISLLSLLTLSPYPWLMGTFVLGVWQVLSALLNSFPMYSTTYRTRILLYWVLAVIAVSILFFQTDEAMIASMTISWCIAVYYWFVYKSFIDYVAFRKELSTIVRHH
jgi:hypothetical protein